MLRRVRNSDLLLLLLLKANATSVAFLTQCYTATTNRADWFNRQFKDETSMTTTLTHQTNSRVYWFRVLIGWCCRFNGRAPGSDGIAAELLKCAITPVAKALHFLFTRVWRTGHIPADWKDGILVTLYKGKGPVADCSSYRPITLLSIPGKVFAHVLLARIQPLLDATRRPQQSGFVAGRSTIDAILALRLLAEIHYVVLPGADILHRSAWKFACR